MMAAALPATLKAAAPDVQRFATRAAQLEKFRPIVTYWCEYHILQQILSRQLHSTDEECTQYALQLMDKLEGYKTANASNDAVVDDVAAKAYIENFALETFNRADEAQRLNKVSKQTADTFQASTTFMDLLTIWGQLEPEIQAKQKYAKFHALRIARSIKAGEDPNASNPNVQPPQVPDASLGDDLEAEVRNLEGDTGVYRPPTVESVPDSALPSRPQSTLRNETLIPPPITSPNAGIPLDTRPIEPDVSPIEPPDPGNSRSGSVGGGYFPAVPDAPGNTNALPLPDQPQETTSTSASTDPANFYSTAPPPQIPDPRSLSTASPNRLAPQNAQPQIIPPAHSPHLVSHAPQAKAIPPVAHQPRVVPPPGGYRTDDESVMAAQKHAKWAISALNFEDVDTAVKELRIALNSLGAD